MNNDIITLVITSAPGLLLAVVFHEWAHARVALAFGDNTAEQQGRLTLHPVAHFDLWGMVIIPLICLAAGGGVFGYAKPVPVTPSRFKDVKKGIFWVSFAGPAMNIILGIVSAFIFALVVKFGSENSSSTSFLLNALVRSIQFNFLFAVFNLVPLPPLDGSRMVEPFLSYNQQRTYEQYGQYAFFVFIALLWFTNLGRFVFGPVVYFTVFFRDLFLKLVM